MNRQNETFSTVGTSLKMQCPLTPPQTQRATQEVPKAATTVACPSHRAAWGRGSHTG